MSYKKVHNDLIDSIKEVVSVNGYLHEGKRSGINLQKLSKDIKIRREQLYRILSKKQGLPLHRLYNIAKFFNVSFIIMPEGSVCFKGGEKEIGSFIDFIKEKYNI